MSAAAGANGGAKKGPAAPPPVKPAGGKPDKPGKKKDETIALAAGAVVASGIAWSLYKSFKPKKIEEQEQGLGLVLEDSDDAPLDAGKGPEGSFGDDAPAAAAAPPPSLKKAPSKIYKFKSTKIYEVSKGDTLWSLAAKYNTTVDALRSVNGITDDNIVAGESITVPK